MKHILLNSLLKKKSSGFALIEVAIALIILGIIGSMGLPLIFNSLNYHKVNTTKMRAKEIFSVLGAFVLQEGRLPCPGDPAASFSSFGEEMSTCVQNAEGILPFKTLGLPESFSKDGYGRYFTYAVEPSLTPKELGEGLQKPLESPLSFNILQDRPYPKVPFSRTHAFCKVPPPLFPFQILQEKQGQFISTLRSEKDFVAIVLVSHGEQGYGAYEGNNTLERHPSPLHGIEEEENKNGDKTFIQKNLSLNKDSYFDNLVFWVSRTTLLPLYTHHPCDS